MADDTVNTSKGVNAYKTNRDAVVDGVWVALKGGIEVQIRYEQSPRVQEAVRKIDKKYRSLLITEGGLPPDVQAERDTALLQSDILVDWRGEGLPSVTNRDAVKALLLDPDLADFRRDIVYAARVSDNFRAGEQLKLTGNS